MTAALDELRIDLSTPGFFLRPDYFDVLARLRSEAPIYEYAPGIKAVSRYQDIRTISLDTDRFCSSRGVLVNDPLRQGHAIEGSILHMDPPRHSEWRRILNRNFASRALRPMEDPVRALIAGLLDGLPRGEVVDLGRRLRPLPFPVLVICEVLGCPSRLRSEFRRWSDATIVATDGRSSMSAEASQSRDGAGGLPRSTGQGQGG